jgi:aconitate hydratase
MGETLASTENTIDTYRGKAVYYSLQKMKEAGYPVDRLPLSIKVLLENALRFSGTVPGASEAAVALAEWPKHVSSELPFMPYRVLLQDYTGVPLVVDLAAMRRAAKKEGLRPSSVNSQVPVDLIIDHSVQVDSWLGPTSIMLNLEKEYERNAERYSLLKWAQSSFSGMRIFPPGTGICHQVNLEYIAKVIALHEEEGKLMAFPDTLLGTDSHTTMVNGIGVLGWGVGGIEAEAVMLGEPYHMPIPRVVGVRIKGRLPEGATPTDLVLTVTETLRKTNVVGAFVEYFGEGYEELSAPDRATLGNMSPEYGATVGFAPVDGATLAYLLATGRDPSHVKFVEDYCRAQGLLLSYDSNAIPYSQVIEVDLEKIEPSVAGPRNPDERTPLRSVPALSQGLAQKYRKESSVPLVNTSRIADDGYPFNGAGQQVVVQKEDMATVAEALRDGYVIISAITSCTNTSNPTVMLGAGLLARNAVRSGLTSKPWVKTSMAPGSLVVKNYLEKSGLLPDLEALGFNVVGYGCTTCIGNSGPLDAQIERVVKERDLYVVATLSGNRNFDGRIHPLAKGSFLMSPILVVAYSLAGRIDFDFSKEPLGAATNGNLIFLKDIWPRMQEIRETERASISPELFKGAYSDPLKGDERWKSLKSPQEEVYEWDPNSTYIKEPPWFDPKLLSFRVENVSNARVLALLEDKVTTYHISPAGTISVDSPAAQYLEQHEVKFVQFSSYGSRRGNHEVMVRGGFNNIRLKNVLVRGREGGWTTFLPTGEQMSIYDASMRYQAEGIPLIILAGKQYGTGSSRDWAAKATRLLGVKAVIAESFERIHRSNLVAMGVLPLLFDPDQSWRNLELKGDESYDIKGIADLDEPKKKIEVTARTGDKEKNFTVTAQIDNNVEVDYYRSGGVLPYVFGKLKAGKTAAER